MSGTVGSNPTPSARRSVQPAADSWQPGLTGGELTPRGGTKERLERELAAESLLGEMAEKAEGGRLLSDCRSESFYRGFESLSLRQKRERPMSV